MKKIAAGLLSILIVFSVFGQDITGEWNGALKVQGTQLRLVFTITKTGNGFSSTMDSPDQGAKGIPVTTTTFENSKLKLTITNAGIEYNGEYNDTIITGIFKQGGQQLPLDLSRKKIEKLVFVRPQDPVKPYPYYSEEVAFPNAAANIVLAGTLTLPAKEGVYPVAILITGSGPQNRDEELLGHRPFLVISDWLTKNGIAMLRYDDRGTAQSTGDFKTATSADFAADVEAAVAYVKTRKEIKKNKIGLIGHSEGGLIAPMVAAKNKDVQFIVLLAGTGIQGNQLLLLQQELIARASGATEADIQKIKELNTAIFNMVIQSTNTQQLKNDLTNHFKQLLKDSSNARQVNGMNEDEVINAKVEQVANPWMQYFIKYNPVTSLEKVKCPVLAVNGSKDLQVPPKENLAAISNALKKAGNKNVSVKEFPGLNHLFQECTTGLPAEYATIEQTFSPVVLTEITKWIQNQVK
jgi:uncharacterized protein